MNEHKVGRTIMPKCEVCGRPNNGMLCGYCEVWFTSIEDYYYGCYEGFDTLTTMLVVAIQTDAQSNV